MLTGNGAAFPDAVVTSIAALRSDFWQYRHDPDRSGLSLKLEAPIPGPAFLRRIDRRFVSTASGVIVILVLLGLTGLLLRPGSRSSPFYTPGVTPSREDCVITRMKTYSKLTKAILNSIAEDCELTVQSIEGHEMLRKAWEERQAAREAEPQAPPPPPPPKEADRLRRVWN